MSGTQAFEVRNLVFVSGERFPALIDGDTGVPDFEVCAVFSVLTGLWCAERGCGDVAACAARFPSRCRMEYRSANGDRMTRHSFYVSGKTALGSVGT